MTTENMVEHGAIPAFSVRLSEEIGKITQLMGSVRQQGNFPEFMATSLQKLDGKSPEVVKIIRDAIEEQATTVDREDMFWRLWGTATIAEILLKEFGQPKQPATTG